MYKLQRALRGKATAKWNWSQFETGNGSSPRLFFFSQRECFYNEKKKEKSTSSFFMQLLRSHPLCIGIYVYKLSIYATIYIGISTWCAVRVVVSYDLDATITIILMFVDCIRWELRNDNSFSPIVGAKPNNENARSRFNALLFRSTTE